MLCSPSQALLQTEQSSCAGAAYMGQVPDRTTFIAGLSALSRLSHQALRVQKWGASEHEMMSCPMLPQPT